jgi:hypothetical protein
MTAVVKKTVTRVFAESQIPDHLRNEVLKIKVEAAKTAPKAKEPVKSPLTKEVVGSPRPEFLEPMSPTVKVSPDISSKLMMEYQKKNMEEYSQWEIDRPSTWLDQIERLENERSKITKKGKLSAADLQYLDEIDEKIEYCEKVLADLEEDYFEDSE